MGWSELECCCGVGWLRVFHSTLGAKVFLGMQRKTLDPGFRRDDGSCLGNCKTSTVIPAKAGIQRPTPYAEMTIFRPPALKTSSRRKV